MKTGRKHKTALTQIENFKGFKTIQKFKRRLFMFKSRNECFLLLSVFRATPAACTKPTESTGSGTRLEVELVEPSTNQDGTYRGSES